MMNRLTNTLRRFSNSSANEDGATSQIEPAVVVDAIPMQIDEQPPVAQVVGSDVAQSLCVKTECEMSQYVFNERADTHVLVTITGEDKCPEKKKRQPLDVVIVLDNSGSMSGKKLRNCIGTCEFIAKELGENDRLSLVTYDSFVKTRFPLTKMDEAGKASVNSIFKSVHAGSATNLSGGLVQGINELKNGHLRDKAIGAILLLTDGFANEGIADNAGLTQLAKNSLAGFPKDKKPKLYTFGYGNDHSEDLLEALADAGDGAYFSVSNLDDVAGSFADVLGGLLSIVAQSITLEVTPAGGTTITSAPKCKYSSTTIANGGYAIDFPDLYDGESRNILIPLSLPALGSAAEGVNDAPVLTVSVSYTDCILKSPQSISVQAATTRPTKIDEASLVQSTAVKEQLTRLQVMEEMKKAEAFADKGDLASARSCLKQLSSNIAHESALFGNKRPMYNYMLEQVKQVQEVHLQSSAAWGSGGRKMCKSHQQQYAKERNCSSAFVEVEEENVYRTKASKSMRSKIATPPSSVTGASYGPYP
jgi:Mg-chelatase subunit ChlD